MIHLMTSRPDEDPLCPAEVFRRNLEWVRERGGVLSVCRAPDTCEQDRRCKTCFIVKANDPRPWYVLHQRYLHGDA